MVKFILQKNSKSLSLKLNVTANVMFKSKSQKFLIWKAFFIKHANNQTLTHSALRAKHYVPLISHFQSSDVMFLLTDTFQNSLTV